MHHSLLPYRVGGDVFYGRYSPPLQLYPNQPPRYGDPPFLLWLEFGYDPELLKWLADTVEAVGDVLELMHIDRRLLIYGVNVQVMTPSVGLILRPVFNNDVLLSAIDCSFVSKATYLLGGGVLDDTRSLATKTFITDQPDFLGLRIEALGAGLGTLSMKVTLVNNSVFTGRELSNKGKLGTMV